ncbi:MAG: hypothetical protein COA43_05765 [Robiginitomaculum sp.]|nr:MAG: hypothetical protein COA43_05765 [Robiginitomaculum sp.]
MGNTQRKVKQVSNTLSNNIPKPAQDLQNSQEQGHGIIVIEAPISEAQTLVKLRRNSDLWLSPTGWTNIEKSTLLDSETNEADDNTRFIIPANFARELENGDQLVLEILHLGLKSELTWFSTSPDATPSTEIPPLKSKTEAPQNVNHEDMPKQNLLNRFRAKPKNKPTVLSDIEQQAEDARRNAEALTKEMQLAQKAKEAADTRALEAARLAKIASDQELERAQQVAAAQKTLKDAEAARIQEQERIKAEYLAEIARKEQEVIEAERKRHKARLKELLAVKQAKVQTLTQDIEQYEQKINVQKTHIHTLQMDSKKQTAQLQSNTEAQSLAQDHVTKAKTNLMSAQSTLEDSQKQDIATSQICNQSSDQIDNKTKQLKKLDSNIQKSQNLYADAQERAETAIARAKVLQESFIEAKDEHDNLQTDITLIKEQHTANEQKHMAAHSLLETSRTELSRAQDTLKTLQDDYDTTTHTHIRTTNTHHDTMNEIDSVQTQIEVAEGNTQTLQKRLKQIKALKITTETLNEAHQTLEQVTPSQNFTATTTPTSKSVPLANTAPNKILIQEDNPPVQEQIAKPQAKETTHTTSHPTTNKEITETSVATSDDTESILANLAQANTQDSIGITIPDFSLSKRRTLAITTLLLVTVSGLAWLVFQPEKPKPAQTTATQKTVITAPTANSAAQEIDSVVDETAKQSSTIEQETRPISNTTPTATDVTTTKSAETTKPVTPISSPKPQVKKTISTVKKNIEPKVTSVQKNSVARPVARNITLNVKAKTLPISTFTTVKTPVIDPQISNVQTKLQKLGFYNGNITGILDTATTSSLYDFQSLFDLRQTSIITPALLSALASANTIAPTLTISQKPEPQIEPKLQIKEVTDDTPSPAPITPPTTTVQADIETPTPTIEKNTEDVQENTIVVADTIIEPRKVFTPSLQYPLRVLQSKRMETTVIVNVTYDINAAGKVENSLVENITGTTRFERIFSRSALKLVKNMRFSPKTVNGEAVTSQNHTIKIKYPPQN